MQKLIGTALNSGIFIGRAIHISLPEPEIENGVIKYGAAFMPERQNGILSTAKQHCRASAVAVLGKAKYERGERLNAENFVPFYLRSADADQKKSFFGK